jgi:hypothetical protein
MNLVNFQHCRMKLKDINDSGISDAKWIDVYSLTMTYSIANISNQIKIIKIGTMCISVYTAFLNNIDFSRITRMICR